MQDARGLAVFTPVAEPDSSAHRVAPVWGAANDDLEGLRLELERRASEVEELRQDLSLALTLRSTRDAERAQLERELASAKAEIIAGGARGSLETEALAATERALDARVREVVSLRELLEAERQNAAALRRERDVFEQKLDTAAAVEDRENREGDRAADRSEIEGLRAALAATQQQLAEARGEAGELRANLEIASQTLESRREEARSAAGELAELREAAVARAEALANAQRDLREAVQRADRDTLLLDEQLATIAALEQTLEARDRETEAQAERLTIAQRHLDARQAEVDTLTTQLEERDQEATHLHQQVKAARAEIARERQTGSQREASAAALRGALERVAQMAAEASGEARPPVGGSAEESDIEAPVAASGEASEVLHPTGAPAVEVAPPEASTRPAKSTRPAIYRYWRDSQLREKLPDLESLDQLFADAVALRCAALGDATVRVVSLAGPDPELEARIAQRLLDRGVENFSIRCVCGGEHRRRADASAAERGLRARILFEDPPWAPGPDGPSCDVFLADGSLDAAPHALLRKIRADLRPEGALLVAARIGTVDGGDARAVEMGERIWALMPDRYKRDPQRGGNRERFDARELEGPWAGRAGALLRGLETHFHFELFAAFGHLACAFVGPTVGSNFDPENDRDRRFIDQVAGLDEARIASGALAPLSIVARLRPEPVALPHYAQGVTPEQCAARAASRTERRAPGEAGLATA